MKIGPVGTGAFTAPVVSGPPATIEKQAYRCHVPVVDTGRLEHACVAAAGVERPYTRHDHASRMTPIGGVLSGMSGRGGLYDRLSNVLQIAKAAEVGGFRCQAAKVEVISQEKVIDGNHNQNVRARVL
ncbi:MAG: hypothetical protein ACQESR_05385 [Planctomycetota bacterium]